MSARGTLVDLDERVVGEQELAAAARGARQPEVVVRPLERAIRRQSDRAASSPSSRRPVAQVEQAQLEGGVAERSARASGSSRGAPRRPSLRRSRRARARDLAAARGSVAGLASRRASATCAVAERHAHLLDAADRPPAAPPGLRHRRTGRPSDEDAGARARRLAGESSKLDRRSINVLRRLA